MPLYTLEGVEVDFPFDAYPCQLEFMSTTIRALRAGQSATLESPTGTGKTLTLLCAVLAWARHEHRAAEAEGRPPAVSRVFYASRTHSQLKQVMRELQKTAYSDSVVSILASRDHYCVHGGLRRVFGAARNAACSSARKTCFHYKNLDEFMTRESPALEEAAVADVEDLAELGRLHRFCPFYYARRKVIAAQLVLCPYSYILDERMRLRVGIDLTKAVIVIDEAHNASSCVRESASVSVLVEDMTEAEYGIEEARIAAAKSAADRDETEPPPPSDGTMRRVLAAVADIRAATLALLNQHRRQYSDCNKAPGSDPSTYVRPGDYLLEFLAKAGIREVSAAFLYALEWLEAKCGQLPQVDNRAVKAISGVKQLLSRAGMNPPSGAETAHAGSEAQADAQAAQAVAQAAAQAERAEEDLGSTQAEERAAEQASLLSGPEVLRSAFRFAVRTVDDPSGHNNEELLLLCVDPRPSIRQLLGFGPAEIRSLVLASGTLSPLGSFIGELGLNVPENCRLSSGHVIDVRRQLLAVAVSRGHEAVELNSRYGNRASPAYLRALGVSCASIASQTPGGVLVFFQSYSFLRSATDEWKRTMGRVRTLWEELARMKEIFEEGRGGVDARTVHAAYTAAAERGRGALLLAVMRGRMSEGIDFADGQARAVLVVGIPFASVESLQVKLQNQHAQSIGIRDWYLADAMRSVNQAVGRAIRHRHDYGAIVLLDSRFSSPAVRAMLPGWVRAEVRQNLDFHTATQHCTSFFANQYTVERAAPLASPSPAPKRRRVHRILHPTAATEVVEEQVTTAEPDGGPCACAPAGQAAQVGPPTNQNVARFYDDVKALLSEQQRQEWKSLVCVELKRVFGQAKADEVGGMPMLCEWMRAVLVPWLRTALGDTGLLRRHVAVLPRVLRPKFIAAVESAQQSGSERSASPPPSPN
eukprot:TRINITY_DN35463_c0_g1_i1.p1 TRINITY_DN35463_c0_g1~~TRINITY_DN35463_c0_g1_i1.p1  ORF type:complete len:949 (+),score=274.51 TRINITY_DN35463_c0_g1_i1:63-2849(+)